jgi:16S rRNA pseudouridine516 synthase
VTDIRLDRALANLGHATRREAQRAVRDGRVTVSGQVVRSPEYHADPATVALDGEPLDFPTGLFVAFHKPVGAVCSHEDRDGLRIYDLLPARWLARNPRVTSIGRLDKDSSGLLLVTDILPLVHQLGAPRHHVEKRYVVGLDDPLAPDELAAMVATFASGTLLLKGDDEPCRPAVLRGTDRADHVEVVLTEGRHRQVRRMLGACGVHVASLHRVAVGPYELGDLPEGHWRVENPPTLLL